MYPYWILFGFFGFGSLFARPQWPTSKKLGMLGLAWLVLLLFIGLRGHIGQDWFGYLEWCLRADRASFSKYMASVYSDHVFYAAIWFLRAVSSPFWLVNTVFALIFVTGLVSFARTQINPWLTIFAAVPYLVIVVALSGMRQSTAIGFEFLSLVALSREHRNRCLFWQVLASLCHASAVVLLPILALSFSKSRVQSIILTLLVAIAVYYVLNSSIDSYLSRYVTTTKLLQSSGTPVRIGTNVVAAVIFFLFGKGIPLSNTERLLWRNMSIIALAAIPMYFFVPSSTSLDRILLYIFPLQMFALGWLPYVSGNKLHKTASAAIIVIYLAAQLFVFLTFGANAEAYIPYKMTDFAG